MYYVYENDDDFIAKFNSEKKAKRKCKKNKNYWYIMVYETF